MCTAVIMYEVYLTNLLAANICFMFQFSVYGLSIKPAMFGFRSPTNPSLAQKQIYKQTNKQTSKQTNCKQTNKTRQKEIPDFS